VPFSYSRGSQWLSIFNNELVQMVVSSVTSRILGGMTSASPTDFHLLLASMHALNTVDKLVMVSFPEDVGRVSLKIVSKKYI